jgi:hypothetical protein
MYIVANPDRKSDVLRRAVHALDINMGLGFMNWQQRLKDMAAKVAAKKIEVSVCKSRSYCVRSPVEASLIGLPTPHNPTLKKIN